MRTLLLWPMLRCAVPHALDVEYDRTYTPDAPACGASTISVPLTATMIAAANAMIVMFIRLRTELNEAVFT